MKRAINGRYLIAFLAFCLIVFSPEAAAGLLSHLFGKGESGTLSITSSPEGARIFIDGKEQEGVTPSIIPDVSWGSRMIRLELDGYAPWFQEVYVRSNKNVDLHAALRPKGTVDKIVFTRLKSGVGEKASLWVMNLDGSEETMILDEFSYSPSWSPDKKNMVFIRDENISRNLYIADVDGTNPMKLVGDKFDFVATPTWSPDGSKIAFISHTRGNSSKSSGGNIYIMNSDGSDLCELKQTYAWGNISWLSQGDAMIFNIYPYGNDREISDAIIIDSSTGDTLGVMNNFYTPFAYGDEKIIIYRSSSKVLLSRVTSDNPLFTTVKETYGNDSEIFSMDIETKEEISIRKFEQESIYLRQILRF